MIKVIRNIEYDFIRFSGDARIISGRSHNVRRIRGVLRASVNMIGDIGVKLLNKGMKKRVRIRVEFKVRDNLRGYRVRNNITVKVRIRAVIQVATGSRSWAPKARILIKLQPEKLKRSGSRMGGKRGGRGVKSRYRKKGGTVASKRGNN